MAAATMKTSTGLDNFFIYNSTLSTKEGTEHKKILMYIPIEEDIDKKIKNIGLCEALVQFSKTFSPDEPCDSLHTQKSRQVFYEPEKDFWMIMTVKIPFSEKMTKDGKKVTEYHDEDILDSVNSAVLKQAYRMFKLFNGCYRYIFDTYGVDALRKKLEHFYTRYLQTLNFGHFDLLDVFSGIQFLPLDKNTFLKIQSFINVLEQTFSQIRYSIFLYGDQLVWSGLEQDDMRILYKYLTGNLFPATEAELTNEGSKPASTPRSHHGRFITGPPEVSDTPPPRRPPRIFVTTEAGTQEEFFLLVYKALNATVCFLIEAATSSSIDLLRRLDNFTGPQLTTLSNVISEQSRIKQSNSDQQYKYIYFNHMNLAQKSTIHSKRTNQIQAIAAPEIMRLLADIDADFNRFSSSRANEDGETFMKTMSDCWVVGRRSDQREFFVVLNQKNANLIEINEEVKRLSAAHFNNIFFLD